MHYMEDMEKIQILFPEPALRRLRGIAKREDRPVSEIVRMAVDRFLLQIPEPSGTAPKPKLPTFAGGRVKVGPQEMKALIYEDDAL